MTFQFRPARREHTPLIIGLAGPTKSGKTYSAHRLATGLADGKQIVKLNAEGANGHQYDDQFPHVCADITAPFRPERYTEALREAYALNPAVIIIDSGSHMHDGPGGILEYHEDELDRMVGQDYKARERATFAAWVKPKAAETAFIYAMLEARCHIVLCLRAKEKIKIVKGKAPIDLGWQPIVSDKVAFETAFTLMLPPRSKGVPDLALSDMRTPFDKMIQPGRQLDEETGHALAEWAAGGLSEPDAAGADFGEEETAASGSESPSTWAELRAHVHDAGITDDALAAAGRARFPGRTPSSLTAAECAELWEALRPAEQMEIV